MTDTGKGWSEEGNGFPLDNDPAQKIVVINSEEDYQKLSPEEKEGVNRPVRENAFKPNSYDNNGDPIHYSISGGSIEQFSFPEIVCLCGSTRFKEQFFDVAKSLTCEGVIVLAPFHFRKCGDAITPELEIILSKLHFREIDLADEVMILNVGGYIGESTRSEIEYAKSKNKVIKYLEDEAEEVKEFPVGKT